jgi:hypothetical protein
MSSSGKLIISTYPQDEYSVVPAARAFETRCGQHVCRHSGPRHARQRTWFFCGDVGYRGIPWPLAEIACRNKLQLKTLPVKVVD